MEIVGEDGWKTIIEEGKEVEFGRGIWSGVKDRTVSRRHVRFHLPKDDANKNPNSKTRVHFRVIGKNPVWVITKTSNDINVFRKSEGGGMESGDRFCVSAKDPVWFSLKDVGIGSHNEEEIGGELDFGNEPAERLDSGFGLPDASDLDVESVDVADVDPVKEFGFVAMGREFETYPKKMMRDMQNWDWFLEGRREDSDSDDDDGVFEDHKRRRNSGKRKWKKVEEPHHDDNDDDEWTGDSDDDDKEHIAKLRKVHVPKYFTRSKDPSRNAQIKSSNSHRKKATREFGYADEEDETLGGFIVKDDEVELEEEEEGRNDIDEEEDLLEDEDEVED